MKLEDTNIQFIENIKNSNIAISQSGKYLVRSNNQLVWLMDFVTREIIIHKRFKSYIVRGITHDEKFCLFTSEGEKEINVLSLLTLEEVASISTSHIFDLKFISNDSVMFYERDNAIDKSFVKMWNFKTGEIRIVYTYDRVSKCGNSVFFDKDNLVVLSQKDCGEVTCRTFNKSNIESFKIKEGYDASSFSQLRGTKLLVSRRENGVSVGVYDILSNNYSVISKINAIHLRWITDCLFWFVELKPGCNFYSGIMDLSGNILWKAKGSYHFVNSSNDNYFIFDSCCDVLLFKKNEK